MISDDSFKKIKKTAKEFFEKTGFGLEVEISLKEDKTISIILKAEDPQLLIGDGGQTLADIQHLLRVILKKQIAAPKERASLGKDEREDEFYINLDVNDYKEKKADYLKELAKNAADEVALTKKEKILEPMPAYERRLIHLELAERSDVITESVGREPERSVAIKPR